VASKRAQRRKEKRRAHDGKKSYDTQAEAVNGMRQMSGKTPGAVYSAYKCQFCGKFHFGHAPAHVARAITNRKLAKYDK